MMFPYGILYYFECDGSKWLIVMVKLYELSWGIAREG